MFNIIKIQILNYKKYKNYSKIYKEIYLNIKLNF
jgi:hypothetical protein